MPRPIWKGSLSFGLVNIPVKLYSAVIDQRPSFHLLRKEDLSPIKYLRVAKADGKEVPYDDIVKGYEYQKGDYIVLTESDFKKADFKKSNSIEVIDFTEQENINPIYFEKPYFLEPDKGAERPYALLVEALKRSGKVGIGKFVLRTKEKLAMLKPEGEMLILEQMRFEREIRSTEGLSFPEVDVSQKELDMALTLITQLEEPFNPADFHDEYDEELISIIKEKAEKGMVQKRGEMPEPTQVKDLMATLKKSLEEARGKNG